MMVMKIARRVSMVAVGAVAVLASTTMSALAYSPYPGFDPNRAATCSSGYVCQWKDYDYRSWDIQSYRISVLTGQPNLNRMKYRSDRRDTGLNTGSSFQNNGNSGKRACFYANVDYTGSKFCLAMKTSSPGWQDWRNDTAESVRFE